TPAIIAFSELGRFLDQPVKTYSTGMAMRLGFSIATQIEPEVLIIDEALSVGDGYFQKKCMDRLQRFLAEGGTLLFCSHAMYYVSAFCQRALWLRNGRVAAIGETQEVVREYEEFLLEKSRAAGREAASAHAAEPSEAPGPARISAVRLVGGRDEPPSDEESPSRVFRHGEPLAVEVDWRCESPDLRFHLGIGINRIDEVEVAIFATHQDGLEPISGRCAYEAAVRLPALPLLKGSFTIYVFLVDESGLHVYDRRLLRGAFRVESRGYRFGLIAADHTWELGDVAPTRGPAPAVGENPVAGAGRSALTEHAGRASSA
ncbi:MAG TPA: Wzt carbohydrate-binding domain-containing protein, partial [Thermoanaerobaculia bacterium]|nr:Wzt carbohydrate-binding domain-containing protein [Thermoanaerobaculia bacterium]